MTIHQERRTTMDPLQISEARVAEMAAGVAKYLRDERTLYVPTSEPLAANWKAIVQHYFPKALLDTIRTVILTEGVRVPPPFFYAEAVALSSGNFPDFVHLASITYVDIVVFHAAITPRKLFHGLVHAQQFASLGLEAYAGLYLRGFLRTRSWLSIPLEQQAFKLEERFMSAPTTPFSVEEEVKFWASQAAYE
jgi:hypothetical protein